MFCLCPLKPTGIPASSLQELAVSVAGAAIASDEDIDMLHARVDMATHSGPSELGEPAAKRQRAQEDLRPIPPPPLGPPLRATWSASWARATPAANVPLPPQCIPPIWTNRLEALTSRYRLYYGIVNFGILRTSGLVCFGCFFQEH